MLGQGADGVEPVLACIVDTISERDRELLDELDRLVQEKKRELGRKSNMYEFLGITLVLAPLLTINATATMVAAGFGRLCKPLLWKCSARTRAEILFVMRIGPPVIAIVAIAAFMIPSYLTYEPHATDETVSWKLGALATLSSIGVG